MNVRTSLLPMALLALMVSGIAGCAATDSRSGTGEYIDDTVITTKVKAAIVGDSMLRTSEINVETFRNIVQLSGFVSSQEEIDQAVRVAADVGGVESVRNDMRIRPPQ